MKDPPMIGACGDSSPKIHSSIIDIDGNDAGEKLRAEIKVKQRFKNRDRTNIDAGATSATT